MRRRVFRSGEWEHGLRCGECAITFREGMPIVEQFAGLSGDTPCVVPVCVPCGFEHPVCADA